MKTILLTLLLSIGSAISQTIETSKTFTATNYSVLPPQPYRAINITVNTAGCEPGFLYTLYWTYALPIGSAQCVPTKQFLYNTKPFTLTFGAEYEAQYWYCTKEPISHPIPSTTTKE
jgi:hypothetical protein